MTEIDYQKAREYLFGYMDETVNKGSKFDAQMKLLGNICWRLLALLIALLLALYSVHLAVPFYENAYFFRPFSIVFYATIFIGSFAILGAWFSYQVELDFNKKFYKMYFELNFLYTESRLSDMTISELTSFLKNHNEKSKL